LDFTAWATSAEQQAAEAFGGSATRITKSSRRSHHWQNAPLADFGASIVRHVFRAAGYCLELTFCVVYRYFSLIAGSIGQSNPPAR
jgi:hypothetical protein